MVCFVSCVSNWSQSWSSRCGEMAAVIMFGSDDGDDGRGHVNGYGS